MSYTGNFGGGFNLTIEDSTAKYKNGQDLSCAHMQSLYRLCIYAHDCTSCECDRANLM